MNHEISALIDLHGHSRIGAVYVQCDDHVSIHIPGSMGRKPGTDGSIRLTVRATEALVRQLLSAIPKTVGGVG